MAEGDPTDWRRLKACPGCDYSLETLPPEGTCPECGRRYDQQFIILAGLGRGKWDGAAGGKWRGMVGQVVCVLAVLWLFSNGLRGFDALQLQWMVYGGMTAAVLAVQLYGRLLSVREPRMQLWLSREGVGQTLSTPEARRAKSIGENITLFFLPVAYAVLFLGDGHPVGWFPLVLVAAVTVGAVIVWWRRRKRMGVMDGDDYTPYLWPWGTIERIRVNTLPGKRARVRCMVMRKWGRVIMEDWMIDIEIECPENVAELVGRQMTEWCRRPSTCSANSA